MDPHADHASGRCRIEGKRLSGRFPSGNVSVRVVHFLVLTLVFSTGGCQSSPDSSIELLESELRFYEDQLFMQKRELDRQAAQINSCRRYNAALKKELKNGSNRSSSSSAGESSGSAIQDDEINESDLELPPIEFGEEFNPDPQPSDVEGNHGDDESTDLDQLEASELEYDSAFRTNANPPQITKIVLNKRLTGGYSDDRELGTDGLSVVIEPQDEAGEYVSLPGDVTVEAYSQQDGTSQRIGRWDFDAVEVSSHMRESLFGKGIHLRLPWPVGPPTSERIRLVVKYSRPSGNALLAKKDIIIRSSLFADFEVARDAAENEAAAELTATHPEWSPTRR